MPTGVLDLAGPAFQVLHGAWKELKSSIRIRSDRGFSNVHPRCRAQCLPPSPQPKQYRAFDREAKVFGLGWRRARLTVFLLFEHNGCDVGDVQAVIGGETFTGLLSGATFVVDMTAAPSMVPGASRCECCDASGCVNVKLEIEFDVAATTGQRYFTRLFRVCGDGSVHRIPPP